MLLTLPDPAVSLLGPGWLSALGVLIANRNRVETERLDRLFVNTQVLGGRVRCAAD